MAWFVPSAKYMIRFSGSNEAKSKAPAAVVQPGTGIKPIVLRLAFGVSVCPQTVGVKKHKTHHRRTQRQYDRFHKVLLYSSTYSKRQVCIESFGKLGLHAAALPNFFVLLCLCGSKNLPLMFGLRLSALQAGIHSLYWNIFVMLQVPVILHANVFFDLAARNPSDIPTNGIASSRGNTWTTTGTGVACLFFCPTFNPLLPLALLRRQRLIPPTSVLCPHDSTTRNRAGQHRLRYGRALFIIPRVVGLATPSRKPNANVPSGPSILKMLPTTASRPGSVEESV